MVPLDSSFPNVFAFPRFKLGVVICADLWESAVLKTFRTRGVDVVAVPAWTACAQGNRSRAKMEWRALARVRSLEWSTVVAVADHLHNRPTTDVANATGVFRPDYRMAALSTSDAECVVEEVNLASIATARQRWAANGLAPL